MRITAALCWYDEPREHLERVVASVAPLVGEIVAFDGAWNGFPCDVPMSGGKPRLALARAATRAGIALGYASQPWASQSAKRTALYRAASEDADWVLVIDADEELRCDDPHDLRERIARIDRRHSPHAMLMRVATPGIGKGGKDTATAPGGVRFQPRLLRADTSLTVGPHSHRTITTSTHVIQCDGGKDGDMLASLPQARIASLHGASIINRTHDRSAARIAAKAAYGKARIERGID